MRFRILLAMLLLLTTPAFAAQAIWTGKAKQVQTVTYKIMWKCQYSYLGRKFWKIVKGAGCPSTIEVE